MMLPLSEPMTDEQEARARALWRAATIVAEQSRISGVEPSSTDVLDYAGFIMTGVDPYAAPRAARLEYVDGGIPVIHDEATVLTPTQLAGLRAAPIRPRDGYTVETSTAGQS